MFVWLCSFGLRRADRSGELGAVLQAEPDSGQLLELERKRPGCRPWAPSPPSPPHGALPVGVWPWRTQLVWWRRKHCQGSSYVTFSFGGNSPCDAGAFPRGAFSAALHPAWIWLPEVLCELKKAGVEGVVVFGLAWASAHSTAGVRSHRGLRGAPANTAEFGLGAPFAAGPRPHGPVRRRRMAVVSCARRPGRGARASGWSGRLALAFWACPTGVRAARMRREAADRDQCPGADRLGAVRVRLGRHQGSACGHAGRRRREPARGQRPQASEDSGGFACRWVATKGWNGMVGCITEYVRDRPSVRSEGSGGSQRYQCCLSKDLAT